MVSCGRAEVDTSRPFTSVKEAVAIFGERLLLARVNSDAAPKPIRTFSPPSTSSPPFFFSPPSQLNDSVLEVDPVADMSDVFISLKKLEAEVEEAKKELVILKEKESVTEVAIASLHDELRKSKFSVEKPAAAEREIVESYEYSPSLAEALSFRRMECGGYERKMVEVTKRKKKKKPIMPLIGDMFAWKKARDELDDDDLYSYAFSTNLR